MFTNLVSYFVDKDSMLSKSMFVFEFAVLAENKSAYGGSPWDPDI